MTLRTYSKGMGLGGDDVMRDEFIRLAADFPKDPPWRDPTFVGSPVVKHAEQTLPAAVAALLGADAEKYLIVGSAGQGGWTHTPWLVLLDPAVTTSVEDGYYVAYLMSKGGERLYLSLNQGCTALKTAVGLPRAREGLVRRAGAMWSKVRSRAKRLRPLELDLNVGPEVWRGTLYTLGAVAGVEYETAALPSAREMQLDLLEALRLYEHIKQNGGWDAEDLLLAELVLDQAGDTLEQAKRYRQHRTIERQSSHSKRVKKALGTRCMGCTFELSEHYGDRAAGLIDAHHLTPLSSLVDGSVVTFNAKTDFAVLCPNCHRVIHRMPDPSDLDALRAEIAKRPLASLQKTAQPIAPPPQGSAGAD